MSSGPAKSPAPARMAATSSITSAAGYTRPALLDRMHRQEQTFWQHLPVSDDQGLLPVGGENAAKLVRRHDLGRTVWHDAPGTGR